eukprot:977415-Rhodomonas_salina.2
MPGAQTVRSVKRAVPLTVLADQEDAGDGESARTRAMTVTLCSATMFPPKSMSATTGCCAQAAARKQCVGASSRRSAEGGTGRTSKGAEQTWRFGAREDGGSRCWARRKGFGM